VEFPKSLRSLGSAAFTECTGLTAIIFHEGLTEIGYSAFQDCSALEEVRIPDSVNTIDRQVFSGCAELRSATIPANVTTIGDFAFSGCSKLTIRGVPGSESERYASENDIPFEVHSLSAGTHRLRSMRFAARTKTARTTRSSPGRSRSPHPERPWNRRFPTAAAAAAAS
jgi:hypothetical protein